MAALAGVPQSLTSTGAGCPWCVVLAWVTVFSRDTKFPMTKATRYLVAPFKQYCKPVLILGLKARTRTS